MHVFELFNTTEKKHINACFLYEFLNMIYLQEMLPSHKAGFFFGMISSLKGITSLHWNCHSLFPKYEEIVHILKNGSAEVNIFTESWNTSSIPDNMLEIDGYTLFRQDRHGTDKKRGGGIIVYAKTSKNIKIHPDKSLCCNDLEMIVIQMSLTNVREI